MPFAGRISSPRVFSRYSTRRYSSGFMGIRSTVPPWPNADNSYVASRSVGTTTGVVHPTADLTHAPNPLDIRWKLGVPEPQPHDPAAINSQQPTSQRRVLQTALPPSNWKRYRSGRPKRRWPSSCARTWDWTFVDEQPVADRIV